MNDPRQQTPNNTPQEQPSLPQGEYPLYERIKWLPLALECSFRQNNDGMVIHARVVLYPESEGEAALQTTFDPIFFPRETFKSDDQRDAYILAVRENLSSTLGSVISHAVLQEFLSAVHLAGDDVGLNNRTRKDVLNFILKSYAQADTQFLKHKLGMPRTGRPAVTTSTKLARDVRRAAKSLMKESSNGSIPKLAAVAAKLGKTEPALSKQMERYKVSWREIKQLLKSRHNSS